MSSCSKQAPKTETKATVTAPTSDQMIAKASRREENGWIYVHLEGAPDAVGYQHGYLLANEILDLRGALSMVLEHDTKKNWDWYRTESLKLFWSKTPEEYQKEIDGIVKGANAKLGANKIDRGDVVAVNAMEEMAFYYVPWLNSKTDPKAAKNKAPGNCSAFVATGSWTKDGKIVMSHNNWTSYVTGERWNVIMDLVPEKGHRVLMDAMPGFIHSGDDFNVNDAGIMVTETTITQFEGFDPNGIAEFVR
ncbi:MAG: peptidase C45, partial [Terriglobia bacterium]